MGKIYLEEGIFMKNQILLAKFIFVYILFLSILTILCSLKKENDIAQFLKYTTLSNEQNFKVLYNQYKKNSTLISEMLQQNKEIMNILSHTKTTDKNLKIINQKKLLDNPFILYKVLKEVNIKELHFILPNNESYLFFSQSKIYKNYSSNFSEITEYINQTKKPIGGFIQNDKLENITFFHPLFSSKHKYLGAIAISFDTKIFNNNFHTTNNQKFTAFTYLPNITYNKQLLSKIPHDKFDNSYSFYDYSDHTITTLIPIKTIITEELLGIFTIQNHSTYINNIINTYYISLLLFYLFFSALFIYIYKINFKFKNTIKQLAHELHIQEIILFKKSKMAQLGEMIDSVAHQWKTPISIIKLYAEHSILLLQSKNKDIKKVVEFQNKSILQINHLVNTIDEFKAFYKPVSVLENIPIKAVIDSTLILMKDELIRHTINTNIKGDTTSVFSIIPNEFKHILINLFNNSKDAFIKNDIDNRIITLNIINDYKYSQLEIYDNAGGIPEDVLNHIFEPNFTTKNNEMGDGVGLYIVKKIIEKIDGKIEAQNTNDGVCFKIKIRNIDFIG